MYKRRRFGVELEYLSPFNEDFLKAVNKASKATGYRATSKSCGRKIDNSKFWIACPEESASSEINSPAMSSVKKLKKGLKPFMKEIIDTYHKDLEQTNFRFNRVRKSNPREDLVDGECGLHVHVDSPELKGDVELVVKFLECYLIGEKYLYGLQPKSRKYTEWCRPIGPRLGAFAKEIKKYKSDSVIGEEDGWDDFKGWDIDKEDWELIEDGCSTFQWLRGKGVSVSLGSIKKYGTVEIRIGESSVDLDDICNWTSICRAFVDRCISVVKKDKFPRYETFEGFLRFLKVSPKVQIWARKKYKLKN